VVGKKHSTNDARSPLVQSHISVSAALKKALTSTSMVLNADLKKFTNPMMFPFHAGGVGLALYLKTMRVAAAAPSISELMRSLMP